MLYPNCLQAALLFDRPVHDLEAIVHAFARVEGMHSGAQFNVPESNPGRFYRLFNGAEELMLSFEYCDRPAAAELFRPALSSPFTGIATPDIRKRIARHESHILLEVSHGVLAGVDEDPKFAAMFDAIGRPRSGDSQPQFERRLQVLALMARIAIEHVMPLAVHWTQSDMLLGGEVFDDFAASGDMPGLLHIHPVLFGPRPDAGDEGLVGIRTFGARQWLGRELIIQPGVLPWAASLDTLFAFLKVATMRGGYVIPDGDTFGPEDRSLSYRVLHHDAGANIGYAATEAADVPMVELVPLKHLAHSFVSAEHVPDADAFDDRTFPAAIMPEDQEAKMALANEWAGKRKLAEGIGGRLEVREAGLEQAATPPPAPSSVKPLERAVAPSPRRPVLPGLAGRGPGMRVFGRKGL
jgi:hypothetical protein